MKLTAQIERLIHQAEAKVLQAEGTDTATLLQAIALLEEARELCEIVEEE